MISREEFIQDRSRVFDKVYGALSGIAITTHELRLEILLEMQPECRITGLIIR